MVTIPGGSPNEIVATRVIPDGALNEPFPADSGNWSLTKSRAQFILRLADLNVTEILIGTEIAIAAGPLAGTWKTEATVTVDDERAIVLARKAA